MSLGVATHTHTSWKKISRNWLCASNVFTGSCNEHLIQKIKLKKWPNDKLLRLKLTYALVNQFHDDRRV